MKVQIEINDGPQGPRIWLRSPWYPSVASDCKSVAGARWSPNEKVWTYPLTMDTCRQMRNTFGDRLEIGSSLGEWARRVRKHEDHMEVLGAELDAELKMVPQISPRLAKAMENRTYQKSGAVFIAAGRWSGDFDEPGLGKTATAMAGIMEAGLWRKDTIHLVVAPKTAVQSTWPRELRKWSDDASVFAMLKDGQIARKQILADAMHAHDLGLGPVFVVVNPTMLAVKLEGWCKKCNCWEKHLMEQSMDQMDIHYQDGHKITKEISKQDYPELHETVWDSVIADECHKYLLKIRPSTKGKMPQWAEGAMRLQIKDGGLRVPLTGTPFRGREVNMFGILHWMNPKYYSSFWAWVDSFLEKSDNGYGIDIGGVRPERRQEFNKALAVHTLRRTRHEVRNELPAQMIVDHWVPLEGKHAKQYKDFTREGVAELESGSIESIGVLAELTRLRQFSFGCWDIGSTGKMTPSGHSPKLELLLDMLDERGVNADTEHDRKINTRDDDLKYIVASQFTQIVNFVQEELEAHGIETLKITGAVTGPKRAQAVDDFSSPGGPRVLLVNTTAGGESITLDEWCEEMFILDETFIEDDQVQLRGRIDNRGAKIATRLYHYIRTEGTVEEGIAQNNISQWDMQAELLDRRRGVELATRLLKGI